MNTQVRFDPTPEDVNPYLSIEAGESYGQKAWRKTKEQPLVPIFCLATGIALASAGYFLRMGKQAQMQKALRWRVGLQGAAVVSMLGGSLALSSTEKAAPVGRPGQQPIAEGDIARLAEQRNADRAALEQRIRLAEAREEQEQKRRVEEALLGGGGGGEKAGMFKPRPIIGRDGRDRSLPGTTTTTTQAGSSAGTLPVTTEQEAKQPSGQKLV